MKILMIAPTPFFSDRGCHVRIYGEIRGLQELGHEVLLCTYGLGRDMQGVKTSRIWNPRWYRKRSAGPSVTKIFLLPVLMIRVIKDIRRFKPEVIHAFLHEGAFIAKILSWFYRQPRYFFDMQGSLCGEVIQHRFIKKNGMAYKMLEVLEDWLNKAFPVITQSENLKKFLLEKEVRDEFILNTMDATDTFLFRPQEKRASILKKYGLSEKVPIVAYMGLLEEYQGTDIMFHAFADLHKTHPQVQFLVVGYPNIEKYKKMSNSMGINVCFVGQKRYNECPKYLALADVAVAPKISDYEGDGKLYDYMAMGLPIVVFDREISREITGECAIYVAKKDAKALADGIRYLLDDSMKRQILGKMARERAVEKFSYINMAKKIEQFYKEHKQ